MSHGYFVSCALYRLLLFSSFLPRRWSLGPINDLIFAYARCASLKWKKMKGENDKPDYTNGDSVFPVRDSNPGRSRASLGKSISSWNPSNELVKFLPRDVHPKYTIQTAPPSSSTHTAATPKHSPPPSIQWPPHHHQPHQNLASFNSTPPPLQP